MTTTETHSHDGTPRDLTCWDDRVRLCGRHFHFCDLSRKHYWEAVGPPAKAWPLLGPRVRAVAEGLARKDSTLSIHMVMVGESQETSYPRVLFCAHDVHLRDAIRNDESLKGIMNDYPAIGIDFCSNAPVHLASHGSGVPPPQACHEGPGGDPRGVWAADVEQKTGRRLYISGLCGGPRRIATGGPIFFTESKAYQTTVRHAFSKSGKSSPPKSSPSFQSDLDLEPSDDEDNLGGDLKDGSNVERDDISPSEEHLSYEPQPTQAPFDGTQGSVRPPAMPPTFTEAALEVETQGGEAGELAVPKGCVCAGRAVEETVTGRERSLDYVLVEVQIDNEDDPNLVSYDPSESSKRVRITRPGSIDDIASDASVVVITSSGPVRGKLSTTPAYIKPNNCYEFEAVYPVTVDDGQALEPGDCGSAVIETRAGKVFGHVVFGHPGTRIVYILPMDKIIADIARALELDRDQHLALQRKEHMMRGVRTEHHISTEFASPKFYMDMTRGTMPQRHLLHSLCSTIRGKANSAMLLKRRWVRPRRVVDGTFESWFFSFPPEIRDEVIGWLDFRSAMNLRQVSPRWRDAVSANGPAISKRFLVRNPLLPLARQLYPHRCPDLAHIQKVGHCHAVASKLADHIATWLRREMYLYESRFQQMDFQATKVQIKRRLVPSLFLLVHFFQGYPQSLLDSCRQEAAELPGEHSSIAFPFERNIMKFYDDRYIQQTHDVMLILTTFLRRSIRPPSKYGVIEKTLHGYLKDPPSDGELAKVICFGGLDEVAKFLDIDSYGHRVTAVRAYASSITTLQAESRPSTSASGSTTGKRSSLTLAGGDRNGAATRSPRLQPSELRLILPSLPPLDDIWHRTGEAVLRERGIVPTPNSYAGALRELIRREHTLADSLYEEGHGLWHALSDKEVRVGSKAPEN